VKFRKLRLLLFVYPRRFRERFGDELIQALEASRDRRSGHHTGFRALYSHSLDIWNVVQGGLAERARSISKRVATFASGKPRSPQLRKEPTMLRLAQDLRFAVRTLFKQPGFTAIVVVTVGLGVGANTAMFSIVNGVILRQLPFEGPERLVRIFQSDRFNGTLREGVSGPDYFDYLEQQTAFEQMAAWTGASPTLTDGLSEPERVPMAMVTRTLFPTLGWQAELGRTFTPDEDTPGGRSVVVLSQGLWKRRFGSDTGVIGRSIELDGAQYAVVGVMPEGFQFLPNVGVWVPLQYDRNTGQRGNHGLSVIARLRDGITLEAAREAMAGIMARLEEAYPEDNVGRGATVDLLEFTITGAVRPALLLLMGAVALVLVIACANVANLLFTRGTTRQREVAVRAALGAGRSRLIGQLLTESLLLAVIGGVIGVFAAFGGVRLLRVLNPANLPRMNEITLSPTVLAFALALTAITGIMFGVLPALQTSSTELNEALSEGGRSSTAARAGKARSVLAVVQIAMAFLLVVGAGLLIKSMWNLTRVNAGFQHENLVRLSVTLPAARYPNSFQYWPDVPDVHRFHSEVLARAASVPVISSAALAVNSPVNAGWTSRVIIEGGPQTVEEGVEEERMRPVSHGYFKTIGTPVLQGREFTEFDRGDTPAVVVVNEALARKYFPNEPALGKRLQFWGVMREIVGVVGDVRFMGLNAPPRPAVYSPMSQVPMSQFDIIVRSSEAPDQIVSRMRSEILQIDRQLAVYNTGSFGTFLAGSLAPQRFNLIMLALFASLALVLAAVGIFGVISYGVSQRVHEFGVRLSLGADQGQLRRLVLGQALRMTAIGIVIGLAGSLAGGRFISGLLFDVAALDPATLAGVAVFLSGVALIASVAPAIRAGRVDPMVALRQE
jgi:putative ABC transport system permease protein